MPIALTCSKDIKRFLVISVDDLNFNIYLNYYCLGQKVHKKIKDICSKLKVAMAVEISRCNNIVFIGGSDTYDIEKGKPVISAVTLDEEMREICTLELSEDSMRNIYSVKRIAGTNAVLVSGEKSICVLEFCHDVSGQAESRFLEMKHLRNIHSQEIFRFAIAGREVLSICPTDNYIHKF